MLVHFKTCRRLANKEDAEIAATYSAIPLFASLYVFFWYFLFMDK